jgi:hypothetical protein
MAIATAIAAARIVAGKVLVDARSIAKLYHATPPRAQKTTCLCDLTAPRGCCRKATQPRLALRAGDTYLIDIIDGAIRGGWVFRPPAVC